MHIHNTSEASTNHYPDKNECVNGKVRVIEKYEIEMEG